MAWGRLGRCLYWQQHFWAPGSVALKFIIISDIDFQEDLELMETQGLELKPWEYLLRSPLDAVILFNLFSS